MGVPRGIRVVAAIASCIVGVTACTVHGKARSQAPAGTPSASPRPTPTITVLRSVHALVAGQSTELTAQAGVRMTLRASRPRASRNRLSSSYGYAPARGYYVTFEVTVVNTGSASFAIGPSNFRVRIPGEGTVTTYSGNAPYSGASEQLDATQLDPGQSVRAPVTFDVKRPHGVLSYVPDRSAAVTWTF